jgi:hypothetical protein
MIARSTAFLPEVVGENVLSSRPSPPLDQPLRRRELDCALQSILKGRPRGRGTDQSARDLRRATRDAKDGR